MKKTNGTKTVDMGLEGLTPTKTYTYFPSDPVELEIPLERPKTSRAKGHPSPDDFTDYIIPSKNRLSITPTKKIYIPDEDDFLVNIDSNADISSVDYDELVYIACFLFGAAFNI
jgi:hypothetical protein